jgi:leader peptidase (prepilin peptidase)/N-methyltransferase
VTDTTPIIVAICSVLGLVIGSFLNVVIWRVPRKESIVSPGSHCPNCGRVLTPAENIPVVSWLALRGKCRGCGTKISARYPLVEVACAVLFGVIAAQYADSWILPAYLVFTAAGLALSIIDLEHFLLPNRIVYPLSIAMVPLIAIGALGDDDWKGLLRAVIGGLLAFAFMFIVHVIYPRGMGFGDVKLAWTLGLVLGWISLGVVFLGLFLGFVLGAVIGLVLVVVTKAGRKTRVPFGPFLFVGTYIALLWGQPILDWYLGTSS